MKLYYKVEGSDWSKKYTLKEGLQAKDIDNAKLNLFVAQALWQIKYKKYSWDVKFACEDLERAAKELGSKKAAMYLKERGLASCLTILFITRIVKWIAMRMMFLLKSV